MTRDPMCSKHGLALEPYTPSGGQVSNTHGDGSPRMACPICLKLFRAAMRAVKASGTQGRKAARGAYSTT